MMETGVWIQQTTARLRDAGISTARLDTLVLLEDCLGLDRAIILAHPETRITSEQITALDSVVARRAGHEPLAYIRGTTEFYGRQFSINKNVLEPRPESETIIEMLKRLVGSSELQTAPGANQLIIADIGTGSGALAVTAKLELPESVVYAVDIDANCLDIAAHNAHALRANITFLEGDLFLPLQNAAISPTILLCNLPYVPTDFRINQAATHEPARAIFAGPDGLDAYRELFAQLTASDTKPAYILAESLPAQHADISALADTAGYGISETDDFIQLFTSRPL